MPAASSRTRPSSASTRQRRAAPSSRAEIGDAEEHGRHDLDLRGAELGLEAPSGQRCENRLDRRRPAAASRGRPGSAPPRARSSAALPAGSRTRSSAARASTPSGGESSGATPRTAASPVPTSHAWNGAPLRQRHGLRSGDDQVNASAADYHGSTVAGANTCCLDPDHHAHPRPAVPASPRGTCWQSPLASRLGGLLRGWSGSAGAGGAESQVGVQTLEESRRGLDRAGAPGQVKINREYPEAPRRVAERPCGPHCRVNDMSTG